MSCSLSRATVPMVRIMEDLISFDHHHRVLTLRLWQRRKMIRFGQYMLFRGRPAETGRVHALHTASIQIAKVYWRYFLRDHMAGITPTLLSRLLVSQ